MPALNVEEMKRVALIIAALAALVVGGVLVSVVLDDPKARTGEVERQIRQLEGVELSYISDLEKQASQLISADIEVKGKGQIGFTALSRNSFESSTTIRLTRIGTHGFRTREIINGHQAYGYNLDIGPDTAIPSVRDLNITSVQKAIAHFDELIALTASWPVIAGEWPSSWPVDSDKWSELSDEEIRFIDRDGTDVFYCLKRVEPSHTITTTDQAGADQPTIQPRQAKE